MYGAKYEDLLNNDIDKRRIYTPDLTINHHPTEQSSDNIPPTTLFDNLPPTEPSKQSGGKKKKRFTKNKRRKTHNRKSRKVFRKKWI